MTRPGLYLPSRRAARRATRAEVRCWKAEMSTPGALTTMIARVACPEGKPSSTS